MVARARLSIRLHKVGDVSWLYYLNAENAEDAESNRSLSLLNHSTRDAGATTAQRRGLIRVVVAAGMNHDGMTLQIFHL